MTTAKNIILLSVSLLVCVLLTIFTSFTPEENNETAGNAIASLPPAKPAVAPPPEAKPEFFYHSMISGELAPGDTLSASLKRNKVPAKIHHQIIDNFVDCLDFRRLRPKDKYRIYLDEQGELLRCEYECSPFDCYSLTRENDGFVARKDSILLDVETKMYSGTITTSLFDAFAEQHLKAALLYAFADIFSSRLDFNTEPQPGDSFSLAVETYHKNGEFVGYGNILYAGYEQKDGLVHEGFYYSTPTTPGAHFDAEGRELGATFIKSPVPLGRVTSTFSLRRKHPILGVVRPHLGVDLAAPVGTPIMAAADGKVIFRGTKGGFGRQVILAHAGGYRTHYGHLSRFRKGLTKGTLVSQKDIIGYVGSSGLSTGPHLDYRLEKQGHFLNPFAQKFRPKSVLSGEELAEFKKSTASLAKRIQSAPQPNTLFVRQLVVKPDEELTIL